MTVSSKTSKRETNDKLSYDAYVLSLTFFGRDRKPTMYH